jgi:hypothetical protein
VLPWIQPTTSQDFITTPQPVNNSEHYLQYDYVTYCTDKKENPIFLIYKEFQSGAVAKSYMRKGFLIYVEM